MDRDKVIKGLECCVGYEDTDNEFLCVYEKDNPNCPYSGTGSNETSCMTQLMRDALALLKAQEPITGETSDGYHTFNELYHHRAVLFSVIVANYPDRAWKSKRHHDGTMYDNMFIVGIDTPDGQATYHYDIDPYWDMFKCKVLDNAPEWDGHTPAQAIERIGKLKAQEARVIDFDDVVGGDECWLEAINGACGYADCYACTGTGEVQVFRCNFDNPQYIKASDYLKTWRCWTSRPTDEQMEGTPWMT